jgi:hypothetical protein
MPLEREIIARDLRVIDERLLQLVAEDGLADHRLEIRTRGTEGSSAPALGG